MADLFDYLTWRGDLTLEQAPFNEVDNLVLSTLCYAAFDDVVPEPEGGILPLAAATEGVFARRGRPKEERRPDFWEKVYLLLERAAGTARFGAMALSNYVNHVDEVAEVQFSAVTFHTGRRERFVAYRGTDDTLVGWKEDFNMGCLSPIPSQREAVHYLESVATSGGGRLRLGGHSKGGNLAVYAAAHSRARLRARIQAIYNNDGPGFCAGALDGSAYEEVRERIHTFVPQSSVVGMLLEHEKDYTVVRSRGLGLLQHDPLTWQVEGPAFVCLETVTQGSRFLDRTLKQWVAAMTPVQREIFADALFDILGATGAKTMGELESTSWRSALAAARTFRELDDESRRSLLDALSLFLKAAQSSVTDPANQ